VGAFDRETTWLEEQLGWRNDLAGGTTWLEERLGWRNDLERETQATLKLMNVNKTLQQADDRISA
jgi:hypothetical protein